MSNTSTFALGLGGGLALSQLLSSTPAAPPGPPKLRNSSRGVCVVELDPTGLTVDGARVDVVEAVRRAQVVGCALVTVAPDAPAATYAALLATLRDANIPTHARTQVAERNGRLKTKTEFTLITYPQGHKEASTSRWFRAEAPISWSEARERLIGAGIIDPKLAGRTHAPGGWMLSIDPTQFHAARAEPLPGAPQRNAELASTFTLVEFPDGIWGKKRERWFRAEPPTTWEDARDRLSAAYLIDRTAITWKLFTDPALFRADRAQPLPVHTTLPEGRRPRGADRTGRYAVDGGRTIVRDGDAIVRLERVDLGNERYALSPHETDKLTQRIVRLLNQYGAR